jgi:hypothetical protein
MNYDTFEMPKTFQQEFLEALQGCPEGGSFIWEGGRHNLHGTAKMFGMRIKTRSTKEGLRIWVSAPNSSAPESAQSQPESA